MKMEISFLYYNKQDELCAVLTDDYDDGYVLNTYTLRVYKTNPMSQIYGLLEYVNDDIGYMAEIKMNMVESILSLIEDYDAQEELKHLYKELSGTWLDMKQKGK